MDDITYVHASYRAQPGGCPERADPAGQALEDVQGAEVFGGAAHDGLDLGGNLRGDNLA